MGEEIGKVILGIVSILFTLGLLVLLIKYLILPLLFLVISPVLVVLNFIYKLILYVTKVIKFLFQLMLKKIHSKPSSKENIEEDEEDYMSFEEFMNQGKETARGQTAYEVLGVSRDDDLETIRKVYRNLSKIYHPDINSSTVASEKFISLTNA